MYLVSLYLTLNLDTEVSQFDRERVLRSLRDRLKQSFGSRITVRSNDDHAIAIAFFSNKLEAIETKCEAVMTRIDSAGEARILSSLRQVFAWVGDEFQELEHERRGDGPGTPSAPGWAGFTGTNGHTVVYAQEDEDDPLKMVSRSSRRQFRIPVRK
jgi:uncharacterized protein YlxP (DUF503 family)